LRVDLVDHAATGEREEGDEDFSIDDNRVVDFDKISTRRRSLMRMEWAQDSKQGDQV
jgi:hypothetical protein